MKTFYAVVHQEGDSAFGIHFPDVPGCIAAADTIDEVPAKASEALSLWFEDEEVVTPRTLAQVQELISSGPDIGYIDLLTSGGFFMAIPLVSLTGRTVKANLTMDAGLLQAIDATAKQRGLTRSAFISDVARKAVEA